MDRIHPRRDRPATPRLRSRLRFQPQTESIEARVLLSTAGSALNLHGILTFGPSVQAVRPNTPVAPFGSPLATATFLDPSAHFLNGNHIYVGQKSLVAPDATLNAKSGFIKIGSGSDVLDNVAIIATPNASRSRPTTNVLIGDQTSIGYGATILGSSTIGAYGTVAKPTGVGANAVIDDAVISAGAIVGPLARVGPGVVVPAGMYVLPGVNVTTNAEASTPSLGFVAKIPTATASDLSTLLTRSTALALGYTNLYQGNSATGANPAVASSVTGVYNGNLAAVLGSGQEPGPATSTAATGVTFEPSKAGPKFVGPFKPSVEGDLHNFPARVTGDVRFAATARQVAASLGRSNSLRGDQGQPIKFANAPVTASHVTITSQLGGTTTSGSTTTTTGALNIGRNFVAGQGVVISGGGTAASYSIGDNVTINAGTVVAATSIGSGATIGAKSYITGSSIAAGAVIPPGSVVINNVLVRQVQW